MDKLTIEQLQGVDNRFGKDVLDVFDYERSVEMKSAIGGTSKSAVKEQIKILKDITGGAQLCLESRMQKITCAWIIGCANLISPQKASKFSVFFQPTGLLY